MGDFVGLYIGMLDKLIENVMVILDVCFEVVVEVIEK